MPTLYQRLMAADKRFVLSYGGTASGKSYSAVQKELTIAAERKVKTLVIRKVANTLRDSVIPAFRARMEEMELADKFSENKSDRTLTHENGSQIIFRGLDDPDKLKSFEGLERILVEEAAELDFEDFLELNRRARGRDNIQLTLVFNPMHEEHWLKQHFFDRKDMDDDCVKIHSTYKDNPHLTDADRKQIEMLKLYNENQYRIYALGEWGLRENNAPWLFAFKKQRHLKADIAIMPSFPVYLSFDFNRNPLTCLVVQMSPNKGQHNSFVHFIDEFAVRDQLGELCQQIYAKYSGYHLYLTGDASGSHGDVGFDGKHDSYYTMIRSMLNIPERQAIINTRNLTHNDSRALINTLLFQYPNIYISEKNCPLLIRDCEMAMVDEDSEVPSALKKDRNVYKMDLFDCFRYFFQSFFKDYAARVSLGRVA
ncbi:hypothetical protein CAP35_13075 [Chitinophagaceae bacterium IBVUCB1]|nr:hypothetical protein CAP35_13075 [Chitinophagaceae bacterium IBVUCB1]